MEKISLIFLFATCTLMFVSSAFAGTCSSPSVTNTKTYTTTDASVLTNIAYLAQFDLKCGGSAPNAADNFYAEVNGKFLNVARTKTGSFQVSWTEELTKATRGDHNVNIYDEDTFPQVKKARAGELPKALATVVINHPGAYSGPWLNSEHLAAIMGVFVAYIAITCRSKLLA